MSTVQKTSKYAWELNGNGEVVFAGELGNVGRPRVQSLSVAPLARGSGERFATGEHAFFGRRAPRFVASSDGRFEIPGDGCKRLTLEELRAIGRRRPFRRRRQNALVLLRSENEIRRARGRRNDRRPSV